MKDERGKLKEEKITSLNRNLELTLRSESRSQVLLGLCRAARKKRRFTRRNFELSSCKELCIFIIRLLVR